MAYRAHFDLTIDDDFLEVSNEILDCIKIFNEKNEGLLKIPKNYLIGPEDYKILSNEVIVDFLTDIYKILENQRIINDVNIYPSVFKLKDKLEKYRDLMLKKMILDKKQ